MPARRIRAGSLVCHRQWLGALRGGAAADGNGLACFSLRGEPSKTDVRLNGADGFDVPTVCQCDFVFALPKEKLHDGRGSVSWERQQQIKAKLKEVRRF